MTIFDWYTSGIWHDGIHIMTLFIFCVIMTNLLEMPSFWGNLPDDTYYFPPLSVYNLEVVSCAHIHSGKTDPKDNMHWHDYH